MASFLDVLRPAPKHNEHRACFRNFPDQTHEHQLSAPRRLTRTALHLELRIMSISRLLPGLPDSQRAGLSENSMFAMDHGCIAQRLAEHFMRVSICAAGVPWQNMKRSSTPLNSVKTACTVQVCKLLQFSSVDHVWQSEV